MSGLRYLLASRLGVRFPLGTRPALAAPIECRPRIFTDVSVILKHDAQTGIQRVVRAIWINLLSRSGETFDVVPVFASRTHGYRCARPDFLEVPVADRLPGTPVRPAPGDHFLGLDLSAHVLPAHERQLRGWRLAGVTTHLVVYDLLPIQQPDWFTEKAVRRFNRWIQVVRNSCDQALCISDQVAQDLREHLSAASVRPSIGRLRLAGDIDGSHPSRGIGPDVQRAIEFAMRHPAVLMVGTVEPRKGYDLALAAFERLWKDMGHAAPALIIAGKPGWRTDSLQERLSTHPELGRRLFWLSAVSDEGLGQLYEASRGVLLTSRAEGFGLPVIEAALHRKNVLARDLPVFREQKLPNVRYFQSDHPAALSVQIADLAGSGPAPAVQLPTWSDCVANLLAEIGLEPKGEAPVPAVMLEAS